MPPPLRIVNFGARLVPYPLATALQDALAAELRAGRGQDTVLVLQHEPVITLGKRGTPADIRTASTTTAVSSSPPVAVAPRGGQATYHGPGQAVLYPILRLRAWHLGARAYVEALEDAMIAVAGAAGVAARGRVPGAAGVWCGDRKLGAVGVRVSGGVTTHGLAFNVATDLDAFGRLVPCGDARARVMTSLHERLAAANVPAAQMPDTIATGDALAGALARGLSGEAVWGGVGAAVAVVGGDVRDALRPWF